MLNQKELLILANLRNNARESLTRLSRKTSIPVSTIYDKIKVYENDLITRNTCLLDFSKLGFNTRATILLKIKKEDKEKVRESLSKNKSVNSFYKIMSRYDYLVEGIFKEIKHVESFIEALEKEFAVEEKEVYYVLEDIRKEAFLSSPEYIKLMGGEQ